MGGAPEADPQLLDEVLTTAEMELRYEGYLEKERERAETLRRQADFPLPEVLPYPELVSLSFEARQKLDRIRPATLAQAARIPGVSPSDLQNLVMEVRKRRDRAGTAGWRLRQPPSLRFPKLHRRKTAFENRFYRVISTCRVHPVVSEAETR